MVPSLPEASMPCSTSTTLRRASAQSRLWRSVEDVGELGGARLAVDLLTQPEARRRVPLHEVGGLARLDRGALPKSASPWIALRHGRGP